MDEEQERLQKVALDIMNDIDRKCLRKMQVSILYLCKKKKIGCLSKKKKIVYILLDLKLLYSCTLT